MYLLFLLFISFITAAERYRVVPVARGPAGAGSARVLSLVNFVREEDPVRIPDYNRRAHFGAWITRGGRCLNTRALVLMRDSLSPVEMRDECNVLRGRWHDPYTGQTYRDARDLQVDHMVPLKNAYESGLWKLEKKQRCHYANYIGYAAHLRPVNASENMRKGDGGPDRYMPPNRSEACSYLREWLFIKAVWSLSMTDEETKAVRQLLKSHRCTTKYRSVRTVHYQQQRLQARRVVSACARL